MEKLTKEEVLHVANLAKLELKDEEIEDYAIKLKQILDKINEINEVNTSDSSIMIAPFSNECLMRDDSDDEMLEKDEVLKNAKNVYDPYIEVRGVFDE